MYQLTSVAKLYHKGRRTVPAVEDLTVTISDGQWLAVQGRTGHGKSTLLNLLGGLDRPTHGTVELDGTSLGALPETRLTQVRAAKIGFIFQTFNLIPTLSAAENVEAALIPLGAGRSNRGERAAAALESVGLADRAELERLWRDRGLTLILVTHDTTIARRAQRVAVMYDGHLTIRQDSPNR